jgi:phosphoglycolate phosphatase-like HAD superfamily hydrolase
VAVDHPDWRWRTTPKEGGPAVIFDIDGVLADAEHRQDILFSGGKGRRKNWKAFFAAAGDDAVIEEVARCSQLMDRDLCIVLLTARPTTIQDVTVTWLRQHDLRWDLLVMRPEGDFRSSPEAKRMAVHELRAAGFELRLAFDDDRRNVDMFHDEGVPCIYIHSGYYEA